MLRIIISSLVMKLSSPTRIVDTSHAGLTLVGWKSRIVRHSRVEVCKRPEGMIMRIAGDTKGYSKGKMRVPQY